MRIDEQTQRAPGLRRGLNIWEAIGISVALMAPSTAANINPQGIDAVLFGAKPFDVFLWSGTFGTLILLIAYGLATIGAMRLLFFFSWRRLAPPWEIVIPVLALLVIGYTLNRNVLSGRGPARS
jgi:hypothetical protein